MGRASSAIPKDILTTTGDLIVASAANTPARLAMGTALQGVRVNAGATALEYAAAGGDVTLAGVQTLTNKRVTARVGTVADSATPTPAGDDQDMFTVTALAQAATFGAPTGTPTNGQKLVIRVLDNGTARALAWNAVYRAGTDIALPATTVLSKTLYCGFIYNSAATKWDLIAVTGNI